MTFKEKKDMVKQKTASFAADHPWSLLYIATVVTVSLLIQVVWR